MINKYWFELIRKYSFVDDVKQVGASFVITYTENEEEKSKKLPLRTSRERLQRILNEIKNKVGNKNEEKYEDKGISICAI